MLPRRRPSRRRLLDFVASLAEAAAPAPAGNLRGEAACPAEKQTRPQRRNEARASARRSGQGDLSTARFSGRRAKQSSTALTRPRPKGMFEASSPRLRAEASHREVVDDDRLRGQFR